MVIVQFSITYTQWHCPRDIDEVECVNHAVKGYRSKLGKLAKDFPAFHGRRGLTKLVIIKVKHGVCCAIRKHSETNDMV